MATGATRLWRLDSMNQSVKERAYDGILANSGTHVEIMFWSRARSQPLAPPIIIAGESTGGIPRMTAMLSGGEAGDTL